MRRHRLLIFGGYVGQLAGGASAGLVFNRLNELWAINTTTLAAVAVAAAGPGPPAVAEHTATVVGTRVIVLGGSTTSGFLLSVWELELGTGGPPVWSNYTPSGGVLQLAGHTAVYHAATGQILVFGGYAPGRTGLTSRSRTLFS